MLVLLLSFKAIVFYSVWKSNIKITILAKFHGLHYREVTGLVASVCLSVLVVLLSFKAALYSVWKSSIKITILAF